MRCSTAKFSSSRLDSVEASHPELLESVWPVCCQYPEVVDGTRDIAEGLSILQELVIVVVDGERADSTSLLNFLLLGEKYSR